MLKIGFFRAWEFDDRGQMDTDRSFISISVDPRSFVVQDFSQA
jgi:hypothetical protein